MVLLNFTTWLSRLWSTAGRPKPVPCAGGPVPTAIILAAALRDGCVATRARAARCLGDMGHVAADALPALLAGTRDRHPLVRDTARMALQRVRLVPQS